MVSDSWFDAVGALIKRPRMRSIHRLRQQTIQPGFRHGTALDLPAANCIRSECRAANDRPYGGGNPGFVIASQCAHWRGNPRPPSPVKVSVIETDPSTGLEAGPPPLQAGEVLRGAAGGQ